MQLSFDHRVFEDDQFERLSRISNGHLYNQRRRHL